MTIGRRDIIEILREEIEQLKKQNRQLSARLARQQQAFRVLAQMLDKIRELNKDNTLDLPTILHELLADVMHVCNTENGSLLLADEDAGELEFVAVIGEASKHLVNHRIPMGTGLVGQVVETGKPLLVDDVRKAQGWSAAIDNRLNFNTESLMCVPVTSHDLVVGAIEIVTHRGDPTFDENDLNVLRVAGRLVSQVLECIEENMLLAGDEK